MKNSKQDSLPTNWEERNRKKKKDSIGTKFASTQENKPDLVTMRLDCDSKCLGYKETEMDGQTDRLLELLT